MARHQLTYSQIEQLQEDIQRQSTISPAFAVFNKEKIARFFNQNKTVLSIIIRKRAEFVKQYVQHDDAGKPLTVKKDDGEHYAFVDKQTEDDYVKAITDFLNISNHIEL